MSSRSAIRELAQTLRTLADLLEQAAEEIIATPAVRPRHDPQLRRLLSLSAAAEYLGVSRRTAAALAASGELPKVRIGTRVLYDQVDLDAFIERLKTEP